VSDFWLWFGALNVVAFLLGIVRAGSLMPVRSRWATGGLVRAGDAVPDIVPVYNWVVCGFDEDGWDRREVLDARLAT